MCGTQAFVMADTTYNSLGVDEVAAQHVNAQCIVSFSACIWTDLRSMLCSKTCSVTVFAPGHDSLGGPCSRSLASKLCAYADTLWARLPEPALKAASILRLP